jgi:hypothetical protein
MAPGKVPASSTAPIDIVGRLIILVVPIAGHRHVHPVYRSSDRLGKPVGYPHHQPHVLGLDDMFVREITVTEMKPELDIGMDSIAQTNQALDDRLLRIFLGPMRPRAIQIFDLMCDVPLNGQLRIWNPGNDPLDLNQHPLFEWTFHRNPLVGHYSLINDIVGCGKRNLKPAFRMDGAFPLKSIENSERLKSDIRLSQIAESQVLYVEAFFNHVPAHIFPLCEVCLVAPISTHSLVFWRAL